MDSQRNVVEGTPFQAIVEDFAAISKDNAVLHALLQFLPDRGHLQQVDGAPEDLEINHRRFASTARLEIASHFVRIISCMGYTAKREFSLARLALQLLTSLGKNQTLLTLERSHSLAHRCTWQTFVANSGP